MNFEVKDGSFAYPGGREIFRRINLKMEDGMTLSVLGANGVGKTTLMKCLLGLLSWKSGSSTLDGKDFVSYEAGEIWKRIAYVPQAKNLIFPCTCEEMVLLGRSAYLGMFAMPKKKDKEIAEEAMELAGVTHLRHQPCNRISGGELQLVLIARALAAKPELLVLDEPETGLDFRNQLLVLDLVQKLCALGKMAAIINTHYPEHALRISQKTLLLSGEGEHLFGDTREVLTDENMKNAFRVNLALCKEAIQGKTYTTVIPVSLIL